MRRPHGSSSANPRGRARARAGAARVGPRASATSRVVGRLVSRLGAGAMNAAGLGGGFVRQADDLPILRRHFGRRSRRFRVRPSRRVGRAERGVETSPVRHRSLGCQRSAIGRSGEPSGSANRNVAARCADARLQSREDAHLTRAAGDEMHGVHGARLADAIDAAGALLESHGIPRQLDVNHHATRVMKIQSFGAGVGGQERPRTTADEGRRSRGAARCGSVRRAATRRRVPGSVEYARACRGIR